MATTTQRYLPTNFTVLGTGIAWASGQAAVSGSVSDWATSIVPSGQKSRTLVFGGFNIDIPATHGIVGMRAYVTGNVDSTIGNAAFFNFSLYDGANTSFLGTSQQKQLVPLSFDGSFVGTASTHAIAPSDNVWGTHISLTNSLVASTGFAIAVSGNYYPSGGFPANTGTFRIASVALEVDTQPIAIRRTGGSTIYRLGGSTISQ